MTPFRLVLVSAVVALSACMAPEPASRAATEAHALSGGAAAVATQWNVRSVEVLVPHSLRVSEANMYFPLADIVWRGDARGDRYAQVDAIVTEAATRATKGMTQGTPVTVEITMKRFHALTEKARYSFGGKYGVKFDLTLRDAQSGAVLAQRPVSAGHPASGGQKAMDEEERGLTEKVVITDFMAGLIRAEIAATVAAPEVLSSAN